MAKAMSRGHSAIVAAAGAAIAGLICAAIALLPEDFAVDVLTASAGVFSGVYFGVAISSATAKKAAANIVVSLLFFACAIAVARVSPLFFALACFAHAGWDIVIAHPKALNEPVASWYAPICVGADIVLGVFALAWFW